MKLFLTVALLFGASFSFAQSFVDEVVSNGEGSVASSDYFDVNSESGGKTVQLYVEAQASSEDGAWALAYFNSGSSVYAEAPYGARYIGGRYWDENFDSVNVAPWSTVTFSTNVVAYALPGEYARALIAGSW